MTRGEHDTLRYDVTIVLAPCTIHYDDARLARMQKDMQKLEVGVWKHKKRPGDDA